MSVRTLLKSTDQVDPSFFTDANKAVFNEALALGGQTAASDADVDAGADASRYVSAATLKKGQANGTASLDVGGKVPHDQLPFEAYGQRFAAGSQADMLALDVQPGDSCLRSDDGNHTWLLVGPDPTQLESWTRQLTTVDAPVQSVNGKTGNLALAPADIGAAAAADLTAHATATNNPHAVTRAQVGLGNVTNDLQLKASQLGQPGGAAPLGLDGKVPAANLPPGNGGTIAAATPQAPGVIRLGGDLAGTADAPTVPGLSSRATVTQLSAHATATNNPHAVTKVQVGLGLVPNVDATSRANHTGTQDAATIGSGTLDFARLPAGNQVNTVAAGNDARLVAAPRVVPSIAVLRALPAPVAGVDSGHVIVQGYYGPGTAGGGEFLFDAAATPGALTGFTCDSGYQLGSGYPNNLTITLSAPDLPGGVQASVHVATFFPAGHTLAGGIADLRVDNPGRGYTQAPTLVFSADAPTPFQRAVLHPHGNWDDGGRTIVGVAGVWRRIGVSPTLVDTAEYGVVYNDPTQADNNSNRLDAARRALPIAGSPSPQAGAITYGPSYTVPAATVRQGTLLVHAGNLWIGRTFLLTPELTLSSGSEVVTFCAKPGFCTAAAPANMVQLALNTEYVSTTYPAPPSQQINATYRCVVDGHVCCNGNGVPGIGGFVLFGAQGCKGTQEIEGIGCVAPAISTNFSVPVLTSLGGTCPLIYIANCYGNQWNQIDAEHGSPGGNDPDGNPYRFVYFEACQNVSVGYMSGEAAQPQPGSQYCTLRNVSMRVGQMSQNLLTDLFLLTQGSTLDIGSMQSVGAVYPGNWIDDRTAQLALPQGTPSYRSQPLAAPRLTGDSVSDSLLVTTAIPAARPVRGLANNVAAHTGALVVGNPSSSDTEYSARQAMLWGSNANNHIYEALRMPPSRGSYERVFGYQDGNGADHELAWLNPQGLKLLTGVFSGNGSGLQNVNVSGGTVFTPFLSFAEGGGVDLTGVALQDLSGAGEAIAEEDGKFRAYATDADSHFVATPLAPGQAQRLNAQGTAMEAYLPSPGTPYVEADFAAALNGTYEVGSLQNLVHVTLPAGQAVGNYVLLVLRGSDAWANLLVNNGGTTEFLAQDAAAVLYRYRQTGSSSYAWVRTVIALPQPNVQAITPSASAAVPVAISVTTNVARLGSALSHAQKLILPPASGCTPGRPIRLVDVPGYSSATNPVSVVPGGGDQCAVPGGAYGTAPLLALAGQGAVDLIPDVDGGGTGRWLVVRLGNPVIPDADPHIVGAPYWTNGVATRSNG